MVTLLFIRSFFFILCAIVGYYVGALLQDSTLGWQLGALSGLVLIFLEQRMHRVSVRGLSSMVFGLLLGIFMAKLISDILLLLPLGMFVHSVSRIVLTVIFSYLGAVMALRGRDEFSIIIPYIRFKRQDIQAENILVDTSALIDGRLLDLARVNFLNGRLVIPRFVLIELQLLADSPDAVRRERGRRGLDYVEKLQAEPIIDVRIHEEELMRAKTVDEKLMLLAKLVDASICTTDFNLTRVASVQKIKVLNVNELAKAIQVKIFAGDVLKVKLVKEGKERGQAIGYMDNGTMIVVVGAQDAIGQTVDVEVTSVLQTQAGSIIFARKC